MTKADILAALQQANPQAPMARIAICADAIVDYRAAQANIDEHGTIVYHPRTGAPIPNPYLPVRAAAAKSVLSLRLQIGDLLTQQTAQ